MAKPVTIKFYPRTDQVFEGGKLPICARVILNREKFDFSSKQCIENLSDWDEKTLRVKLKSPLNVSLSELENRIYEAYNFLKYHNKPLTTLALRNQLRDENRQKHRLFEFAEYYLAKNIKGNNELALANPSCLFFRI